MSFDWSKYESEAPKKESFNWYDYESPDVENDRLEDLYRLSPEQVKELPFEQKALLSKRIGEQAKHEANTAVSSGLLPGITSLAERKSREAGIIPNVKSIPKEAAITGEVLGSLNPISLWSAAVKAGPLYAAKFLQEFPAFGQFLARTGVNAVTGAGVQGAEQFAQTGEAPDLEELAKMTLLFGVGHAAAEGAGAAANAISKRSHVEIPGGIAPPEPPGGGFPGIGDQTPIGSNSFELAENALQKLQAPESIRPQGISVSPKGNQSEGKSLKGRVEDVTTLKERPEGVNVKIPETPKEAKPLTGRAKVAEQNATSHISDTKFESPKKGGVNLATKVKNEAKLQKEPVTKKYKVAEKVYENQQDTFPKLIVEIDETLGRLGESAKLNTSEKAVYDQLTALKGLISVNGDMVDVPLSRLIRTADSMSGLANYEVAYNGPKDILKKFVKSINNEVIDSLNRKGLNANAMKEADKAYSVWANKFLNDEISPFLERRIKDPESLYKQATSDVGKFRALRAAFGEKGIESINKLERQIADNILTPYYKNIEKVGSAKFNEDIKALEGIIGKEKANRAKNILEKEKSRPKPSVSPEQAGKGSKRKIEPSRITSATQNNVPNKAAKGIRPQAEKRPITSLRKERVTSATQEKASQYLNKDPEDIQKALDSVSGIRRLRKDLAAKGHPELFDKLAEEKGLEIIRGGITTPEKITGEVLYDSLKNQKNYEILTELFGKEAVNAAVKDAVIAKNTTLHYKKLVQLGKIGATLIGASKLLKVLTAVLT